MKKWLVLQAVAVVCWPGEASAGLLSLSLSSPNNLTGLSLGDSALINVNLSGLGAGEQLVSLTGSVHFPGALLNTPLSLSQGSIIPDATDFLSGSVAGQADGTFLTLNADPSRRISQNGLFYSFRVQAQAVGAGDFTLDALALTAEQYDPQDPLLPLLRTVDAGAALPFEITTPVVVVPAPPALGLALLGLAIARRKLRLRID
jgi:hypothetical protein